MEQNGNHDSSDLTSRDADAIRHFRAALAGGEHWYISLLGAMGRWDSAEETYQGRHYRYLIAGEALDWQLLAERLCAAVDGLLPEKERNALILQNQPPVEITREQFSELLGAVRYRQYLNYYYGVTVERALVLAVKDEIRKERLVAGYLRDKDTTDEAYRRIYGAREAILLEQFRREKRSRRLRSISLSELKEFTYWLFKYRIRHSEKSRVASDTKKALDWVSRNGYPQNLFAVGGFQVTDPPFPPAV